MQATRIIPATALAAAAGATAAVTAVVAHRVIHPQRAKPTQILKVDGNRVTLSSTPLTRAPGVLGLLHDDERRLVVLQPHRASPHSSHSVERWLSSASGASLRPGAGRATGNVFADPSEIGQPFHQVDLTTTLGAAPAWVIGPDRGDTWLIHLHGSLSTRVGALRSVAAASGAALPSLVPSFRGDGEGPPAPRGAFMLGQTEWRDVEPAIQYAIDHGAKRLVLLGWSNGASMALRLAENSKHRAVIAGVVAISPVLDWTSVVRRGVRATGLPRWCAGLALHALQNRSISALLGAPEPIRFRELAWTRPRVPVLVLHSAGDETASYADSVAFHDRSPDLVTLPLLAPAPHALEWNVAPDVFTREIVEWLKTLLEP